MTKLRITLGALIASLFASLLLGAPSQAADPGAGDPFDPQPGDSQPAYEDQTQDLFGGSIRHVDDKGYDRPIRVKFNGPKWYGVKEGDHSDWLMPNGEEDVDYLKLRNEDEVITCVGIYGNPLWFVFLDKMEDSPRSLPNGANYQCVIGLNSR